MNKALHWFIRLWVGFVILLNVVAIAWFFFGYGFWGGLSSVANTFDPRNFGNYVTELILLSPALAASFWKNRRLAGQRVKKNPSL
jgi:hypothetical protein